MLTLVKGFEWFSLFFLPPGMFGVLKSGITSRGFLFVEFIS